MFLKNTNGELHRVKAVTRRVSPAPARGRTRDGYGRNLPTEYEVLIEGSRHWRRVFVACFSNAGTAYVKVGKDRVIVDDVDSCPTLELEPQ